jgi:hypothetical protein
MRIVVSDIETEGLNNCEKLWICGGKDLSTGEVTRFDNCHEDPVAKAAGYRSGTRQLTLSLVITSCHSMQSS